MKIEVYVSTNRVGSKCSTIIEIDDDSTPEQIEEIAGETKDKLVEWGWKQV